MSPRFIVIGENIHTTRVIRRPSARVIEDPEPAIVFTDVDGERRLLPIPAEEQSGQDYGEGRVKHVRSAVRVAMSGDAVGVAYLRKMAAEQIRAGADFLDLNVDEYSYKLPDQIDAMRYLVGLLSEVSSVPLSIDSSNQEILEAGIATASGGASGSALLNSASLERLDALELASATRCPVIVTAAGSSGMPSDAGERVENASRMIEAALEKGIAADLIYVDPLMFPISVDGAFGHHVLDAIRALREKYGPEIHITGGMSNVSFGLPNRRLINDAFLILAIEAGADSGIIDPIQNDIARVLRTDRSARPFQLALDVLNGADRHCRAYIKAARAGELQTSTETIQLA
jgi:cobalamin-dependent methionine synthase I